MRMDNDDLNALMTITFGSSVCAKMLESERATSMGLTVAGPSGSVAGGNEAFDIAIGVSDPIWQIWRMLG